MYSISCLHLPLLQEIASRTLGVPRKNKERKIVHYSISKGCRAPFFFFPLRMGDTHIMYNNSYLFFSYGRTIPSHCYHKKWFHSKPQLLIYLTWWLLEIISRRSRAGQTQQRQLSTRTQRLNISTDFHKKLLFMGPRPFTLQEQWWKHFHCSGSLPGAVMDRSQQRLLASSGCHQPTSICLHLGLASVQNSTSFPNLLHLTK